MKGMLDFLRGVMIAQLLSHDGSVSANACSIANARLLGVRVFACDVHFGLEALVVWFFLHNPKVNFTAARRNDI
jgi:hypothetical protein